MKVQIFKVLLVLCITGVSITAYGSSELKSSNDIYNKLKGVWGWETPGLDCKSLPSKYEFGVGYKTMSIISNKKQPMHDGTTRNIVNYKVVSNDRTSITLAMENETRLNKSGQLALWKIVLVNDNKFYWKISSDPQTQWGPVVKCADQ